MDNFDKYVATMKKVYGADVPLMTRETWDSACVQPRRARPLNDNEFDDNQEAIQNGYPAIY